MKQFNFHDQSGLGLSAESLSLQRWLPPCAQLCLLSSAGLTAGSCLLKTEEWKLIAHVVKIVASFFNRNRKCLWGKAPSESTQRCCYKVKSSLSLPYLSWLFWCAGDSQAQDIVGGRCSPAVVVMGTDVGPSCLPRAEITCWSVSRGSPCSNESGQLVSTKEAFTAQFSRKE